MAVVVPLRMPKLSRLEAEQRNSIAAWRWPLRIPNYEGLTLERVRSSDVQNANAPEADSFVAEVACGDDTLRMTLSRALASNLLAALDAGVVLDPFLRRTSRRSCLKSHCCRCWKGLSATPDDRCE
jgi:hypothetical protein